MLLQTNKYIDTFWHILFMSPFFNFFLHMPLFMTRQKDQRQKHLCYRVCAGLSFESRWAISHQVDPCLTMIGCGSVQIN